MRPLILARHAPDALSVTVTNGNLSSVTPDPSSIALLGTGLLGIVGVVRKRFA